MEYNIIWDNTGEKINFKSLAEMIRWADIYDEDTAEDIKNGMNVGTITLSIGD